VTARNAVTAPPSSPPGGPANVRGCNRSSPSPTMATAPAAPFRRSNQARRRRPCGRSPAAPPRDLPSPAQGTVCPSRRSATPAASSELGEAARLRGSTRSEPHEANRTGLRNPRGGRCFKYRPPGRYLKHRPSPGSQETPPPVHAAARRSSSALRPCLPSLPVVLTALPPPPQN
jgi:hypothetical protein